MCFATDIILNIDPVGGIRGNGILNSNKAIFISSLSIGDNLIGYSPNGCLDTFTVVIYNDPILSLSGFGEYYCLKILYSH